MATIFTLIMNMILFGRVVVWATCPAAINNMEMILQGNVKYQVGSTFDLANLISLGSWTVLESKTT